MHVCTALRSMCGGTRHRQGAAPEPGSDRAIRVGVLSRLPFTTLDPGRPHTRVELVCVDELHNLNLATRSGAEVSDQLKYFAERLPATFVMPASMWRCTACSPVCAAAKSPAGSPSSRPRPLPMAPAPNAGSGVR